MRRLRAFGAAVVEFVAGDDVPLALGIVVTIAVTYLLGHAGKATWWLPPVALVALGALSIWRAVRSKR
ncbi:MAG TPA: hypothetical protein VG899_00845 [Mycobacteriales bacterium]|nr:hypothetical protein [Mycobacteriales bacterium]HWB66403.1 hypothetical protein [Mycobacteriales bacterium]